jgi:23S rRNA (cytosine1962-C5)-methyltransferase
MTAKIFLKSKKDDAVRRFHPWVFSGAIRNIDGKPEDGDVVEIYSHSGEYLATGHYQGDATIAIRIFSFEKTSINRDFWLQRFRKAFKYRAALGLIHNPDTSCYRLIHAEGDGLPGLIVDVYEKTAVLQCHSIGMHRQRALILDALIEAGEGLIRAVYDKSKDTLPPVYAASMENSYVFGCSMPQIVIENGHFFFVDWEAGQKTGFFLDQRNNRQLLTQYVQGKTVLNTFSYSGGFSIYALKAGARLVHSVDVSLKAVEWTKNNIEINQFDPEIHTAFAMDVQKYLKDCPEYEVMIVDPPAFAKSLSKRHNAVQGYKRLNIAAMQKIKPGGMLFTFSCSQVVDRELFYNTIVAAAIEAGRQVQVMHHLSQPPDHPVNLFHPEGAYLKGLALWVE